MLDRADVGELALRRALVPARVADLERPRAAPEREDLGIELGVIEQRPAGRRGRRRRSPRSGARAARSRRSRGRRSSASAARGPRRARPRSAAADRRAGPRRRSSPPSSSRPGARRARCGRSEPRGTPRAGPRGGARSGRFASTSLPLWRAELGQAVADGRGGGGQVGEQVVPDLPLLARPRAQPAAPRGIPLVPGVRTNRSRGSRKPAPGRRVAGSSRPAA